MSHERECGGCTVCCKMPPISEPGFEKAFGEWCRYCRPEGGCSIHSRRPRLCRRYECSWLMGAGADEDRPDKSGILCKYYHYSDTGRTMVIMECHPGALEGVLAAEYKRIVLARGEAVMTIPVHGQVRMWLPRELAHLRKLDGDTIDDGRRAEIAYA